MFAFNSFLFVHLFDSINYEACELRSDVNIFVIISDSFVIDEPSDELVVFACEDEAERLLELNVILDVSFEALIELLLNVVNEKRHNALTCS